MRSLIVALAGLAIVTAASAAPKHAQGVYTLDSDGNCHAANGAIVMPRLCHVLARCKDPKTHKEVKCGTPGAVPTS